MNNQGNILVVDDTNETLSLLTKLLNEHGYTVYPSDSGELALASLKKRIPDLILLDIRMPGIDGFEVCRRIKSNKDLINIPIIFLTAATDIIDKVEGLKIGAADYITKPFEKEELLARVKVHVELFLLNKTLKHYSEELKASNEQLLHFNEVLEEKVQQRTIELQKKNDEFFEFSKKLEESEEKYRFLTENIADVIWIFNISLGKITYVSPTIFQLCGYTDIESMAQDIKTILTDESAKKVVNEIPKRIIEFQKGNSNYYIDQLQQPCKDGSIKWIETVSKYQYSKDGTIEVQGVSRDITQRKETEQALKESEEKYRSFIQHSPEIIYKFSSKKGGLFWSDRVKDILGFNPEEIKDNPFLWNNSIHPDDKTMVEKAIEENNNGADYNIEYRIKTKSGNWIWLHDYFMFRTQIGDEVIIEGHATNITMRKQAEEAMQNSQNFLNSIIDHSPSSMWISDEHGTLLRLNDSCRNILKLSDEEVIGKYNIFNDNILESQELLPLVKDVFEKGKTARFIVSYDSAHVNNLKLKKTVKLILDVSISAIVDSNGKVINAIIQHVDISAQKQAEMALRKSEENTGFFSKICLLDFS